MSGGWSTEGQGKGWGHREGRSREEQGRPGWLCGAGEASRWQPARLCIGAGLTLEKKMGNSRIFHDFRPLGVRASQDADHRPRWAGVRASGRLTEGPFSWATGGQAGAGGREAWREQEGPQKS